MYKYFSIYGLLFMACSLSALDKPNILWLSTEDIGPHLGCYGDTASVTPNLDNLAARGVKFAKAYTVSGVCSPNRSAIITGVYPSTLGTHHMRAGGEGNEISIHPTVPDYIVPFSAYLRETGYYCTNNRKEDYNFVTPDHAWDESGPLAHWRNRKSQDQPFFAVFNNTNTHEGSVRSSREEFAEKTSRLKDSDRQKIENNVPPPFHPDTPISRENWVKYRELITGLDYWVGDHLKALEDAGLAENTIVFFWSDHGAGLPRSKRWLYDSGVHVPVILYVPEKYQEWLNVQPGNVNGDLISSIDFAPTFMQLSGNAIPDYMQGQAFLPLGETVPRDYVFGARDRMDERYDTIRMVRNDQFKYIRNYQPYRPYDQFMNTAEKSPIKMELHRLKAENGLKSGHAWFKQVSKSVEELYDCVADPHELNNLANNPDYQDVLITLRNAHDHWSLETRDLGLIPEAELVVKEQMHGSRYAFSKQVNQKFPEFFKDLRQLATRAAMPSKSDQAYLIENLDHKEPTFRYWAAKGLGLIKHPNQSIIEHLRKALTDKEKVVQIAAAWSLYKVDQIDGEVESVLISGLESDQEWIRLQAATVIDEMDELGRFAIPALRAALDDPANKYMVRVANRALNQLEDGSNTVR